MHWCPYSQKPIKNYKAYEFVWYKTKEIILNPSTYKIPSVIKYVDMNSYSLFCAQGR